MGEHSDKTNDKFRQAIRRFEADQRIWREGRVDELRGRVVGPLKRANETASGRSEAEIDLSIGARRVPTPPGRRSL